MYNIGAAEKRSLDYYEQKANSSGPRGPAIVVISPVSVPVYSRSRASLLSANYSFGLLTTSFSAQKLKSCATNNALPKPNTPFLAF